MSGTPIPDVFVTAEDVTEGKPKYDALPLVYLRDLTIPRPDPYLKGAAGCGVDPSRCLVVEDAPSGIRSGNAAGAKTLAFITSHSRAQVEEAQPTWIVNNLSRRVGHLHCKLWLVY